MGDFTTDGIGNSEGIGTRQCKGPEVGVCLVGPGSRAEVGRAGVDGGGENSESALGLEEILERDQDTHLQMLPRGRCVYECCLLLTVCV